MALFQNHSGIKAFDVFRDERQKFALTKPNITAAWLITSFSWCQIFAPQITWILTLAEISYKQNLVMQKNVFQNDPISARGGIWAFEYTLFIVIVTWKEFSFSTLVGKYWSIALKWTIHARYKHMANFFTLPVPILLRRLTVSSTTTGQLSTPLTVCSRKMLLVVAESGQAEELVHFPHFESTEQCTIMNPNTMS